MRRMLLITLAALAIDTATAAAAGPALPYDVDGDGRQELVIGATNYSRVLPHAGAAVVLDGDRAPRFLTHAVLGLTAQEGGGDFLGSSLAGGDFDADGFGDLVVLDEGYGLDPRLVVIPGSDSGPKAGDAIAVPAPTRMYAYDAIMAVDLNADGFSDLVASTSPEGDPPAGGGFRFFFGGPGGLGEVDPRVVRGNAPYEWVGPGATLAAGDVNGDGFVDLAGAEPGDPYILDGEGGTPGHRAYCPGGPEGPTTCRRFGRGGPGPASLVVADVTGDGLADIVEGVPVPRVVDEDADENGSSGVVRIWRGTPRGPARRAITISKRTAGVPGRARPGDGFGTSVDAADLDRDGHADLVIGTPYESRSGRVTLIRGGPHGAARTGNRTYDRSTAGMPAGLRHTEGFGSFLALLEINGDNAPDLIVGAPTWGGPPAAVFTLPGRRGAFTAAGSTITRGRALGVADLPRGSIPVGATGFGTILGRPSGAR